MADVTIGLFLAVLLSPLLLIVAIVVKLTSTGRVLFRQTRAGKNGIPFAVCKFRTMCADRTPDPSELVPLDHAEITAVGRYLRRFKIDELPQLFNVIMGDMSLVGPRPTLLDQVARYDEFRRYRLLVRPGITGLAQVSGNTAIPWDERILFDIAYVRRCGFLLDAWIMLRTLSVVVLGEPEHPPRFLETPYARFVRPPDDYRAER